MTMDLWYDLAARELPAQDDVLDKLDLGDRAEPDEGSAERESMKVVDFF